MTGNAAARPHGGYRDMSSIRKTERGRLSRPRTRAITLILAAALLAPLLLFAGCSGTGDVFLRLGRTEITENMFVFWLSRYKAQFAYAYGSSVKSTYGVASLDDFWKLESDTGETYDEVFSEYIYQNALTYLTSLHLFEELGLSLSAADTEEVGNAIAELREKYASGSKTEFNAVLQEYGINEKTLRECYLIDKKITVLQNHLFGAGGEQAITDASVEKYYQDNYVRFAQICIFINECPEKSDDGTYITDDSGNISYRDMSAAETAAAKARADEAYAKASAGGTSFDDLVKEYNENSESESYTSGIYLCRDQVLYGGEDADAIFKAVSETDIGKVKKLELGNSIHIFLRLPLDEGAWKKSANSDFFNFYDSSLGNYVPLKEYIKTPLFVGYIEGKTKELADSIEVNEDIKKSRKISTVRENYYF